MIRKIKRKIKKKEKEAVNKRMRTAFIRVTSVNHTESGVVVYTREDILNTIDNWQETKKFSYYVIEHINDDGTNLHWHIVFDFPPNSTTDFKTLKHKFPHGNIDSCRTGVKNCVRYITHIDKPEKKQYSWDDIITNNLNKLELYKIPGSANFYVETNAIVNKILAGEIKPFEIDKTPSEIYINKRSAIKNAFEYRQQLLLTNPDRDVKIIVLQGVTRTGKSTFCKSWAAKHDKSYYFSSASNDFFGEYLGQDIAILDDFDFETVTINKFKKLIDPHINSAIHSRFNNKLFIGDTIFICTNQDITTAYSNANEVDRQAIFDRINCVLIFNDKPSADGIVTYTVNRFENMELKPIEDPMRTWDIKSYIDITADKSKTDDFIKGLREM